ALDLLQQGNDLRVLGELCIDIGNAFAMLGSGVGGEAISWYERAIDRLREVGDWTEVARAYHNLGVLIGESRPAEGLENLARCQEAAERAHEPRWAGWSLFSGVEMRLALGQVEEAERDNQQAGRLLERAEDPLGLQQVEKNEGLILEKKGQWEEGEAAYRRAIERSRKYGLKPEEAESRFLLARLLFKTRNLPKARSELEAAAQLDLPTLKPNLAKPFAELSRQVAQASKTDPSVAGEPASRGTS
ncbi:MAG: tetratricopeptide repeat protein, partial [Thermoplasmata archaeon]|nr:tetratricopeptide repeat protein [Thermoplasmata archaeon]